MLLDYQPGVTKLKKIPVIWPSLFRNNQFETPSKAVEKSWTVFFFEMIMCMYLLLRYYDLEDLVISATYSLNPFSMGLNHCSPFTMPELIFKVSLISEAYFQCQMNLTKNLFYEEVMNKRAAVFL